MDKECIFLDSPKECYVCMQGTQLIQCLLNHQHLKVRPEVKARLHDILEQEIITPRRYKSLSGIAGRLNVVKNDGKSE